jgi:stress-induced morphogen
MGEKGTVTVEWDSKKTPETRELEARLRRTFPDTEAYRFNSASIRVRVIDDRFEGTSVPEREAQVKPLLHELPRRTREDVLMLLLVAPSELRDPWTRESVLNHEFEHPTVSRL